MWARRHPRQSPRKRGAALVELAVVLPVMVLITLGAIETANAIYLKQCLTSIAYEGARVASSTGGTEADAQALCLELLTARKINGATVTCTTITPATAPGTPIVVSVSASVANNSVGVTKYFRGKQMTGTATSPRM